jgi:two-component system, chemotaxis family, protein-glutamate methylesterase/glutaminase
MSGRARVLIIDDSALIRKLLREILASDPGIEVVGAAPDPIAGWREIQRLEPDVITLDVEMPKMDGIAFLERLMRCRPMPVVMVSSLTEQGCVTTLRALELGAVDFVAKPRVDLARGTAALGAELIAKVTAAARSRPRRTAARPPMPMPLPPMATRGALSRATHHVVAIGASTGGTEALCTVLTALPADAPGVVVVQHMPERFTHQFARRLDGLCAVRVREASDGDRILPGHVLIAPGGLNHTEVMRQGASYSVRVFSGPPVGHHRPSVDVLFRSCSSHLGANAVGVILTGMGSDGAQGLLAMKRAGARTIAQDEATSVVFGMPKEAINAGAVDHVLPLEHIARTIIDLCAA